jgi:hypothetical protein
MPIMHNPSPMLLVIWCASNRRLLEAVLPGFFFLAFSSQRFFSQNKKKAKRGGGGRDLCLQMAALPVRRNYSEEDKN